MRIRRLLEAFALACLTVACTADIGGSPSGSQYGPVTTSALMAQVAGLSPPAIFVFDFDDTLFDHIRDEDGNKIDSEWAAYASRGIDHLEAAGIRIAIASKNSNREALARALSKLNSSVFNADFLASPAFQTNTGNGVGKWLAIQRIIAYHDGLSADQNGLPVHRIPASRQKHVAFFDNNRENTDYMENNTSVVTVWVDHNGLDRHEFRGGAATMLELSSGSGQAACDVGQGHTDYCRLCGPCQEGEGDCDNDSECAGDLVCEPDGPGGEVCIQPAGGGDGSETCNVSQGHTDYCKLCGPCQEGEGDCDNDNECAGDLVCEPDGPGGEVCIQPAGGGGGGETCSVSQGHTDYCKLCGPCQEGEGDCDSDSECAGDLVCEPDGPGAEVCIPAGGGGGSSGEGVDKYSRDTLVVKHDGIWLYVYCSGSSVKVSTSGDKRQRWRKRDHRRIWNDTTSQYLFCDELDGGYAPANCYCSGSYENYHQKTAKVSGTGPARIDLNTDLYIAPNNNFNSCLKVIRDNRVHSPCAIEPWRNQTCRKDNGDSFSSSEHAQDCNKFRLND